MFARVAQTAGDLFRQRPHPLLRATRAPILVGPCALTLGHSSIPTVGFNMKRVQKGHVTLKW
jgi:hypothetical protein